MPRGLGRVIVPQSRLTLIGTLILMICGGKKGTVIMRALSMLFFGLAGITLLVGSASYSDVGQIVFRAPVLEFVIGALLLVAGGFSAAYFAQSRSGDPNSAKHN